MQSCPNLAYGFLICIFKLDNRTQVRNCVRLEFHIWALQPYANTDKTVRKGMNAYEWTIFQNTDEKEEETIMGFGGKEADIGERHRRTEMEDEWAAILGGAREFYHYFENNEVRIQADKTILTQRHTNAKTSSITPQIRQAQELASLNYSTCMPKAWNETGHTRRDNKDAENRQWEAYSTGNTGEYEEYTATRTREGTRIDNPKNQMMQLNLRDVANKKKSCEDIKRFYEKTKQNAGITTDAGEQLGTDNSQ